MAIGDDAAAAGMDTVPQSGLVKDGATQLNKTRDYIATFIDAVKTWASGMFVPQTSLWDWGGGSVFNKVATYNGSGNLIAATPTAANHAASKSYVDGVALPSSPWFGGSVGANGPFYTPHGRANSVVSSYVSAWLNSDGRIGASASAAKYKRDVEAYDVPEGWHELEPKTFVYKDDENGTTRLGFIADEANEVSPLLVHHDNGEVEGLHEHALIAMLWGIARQQREQLSVLGEGTVSLTYEVQRQRAVIEELTGRVEALEAAEARRARRRKPTT